jgi:exodeoxyribonuclease III
MQTLLPEYDSEWLCATAKKGYSGTAALLLKQPANSSSSSSSSSTTEQPFVPKVLSVREGIGNAEGDGEGRVLTIEYEHAYVVTVYTPNAGKFVLIHICYSTSMSKCCINATGNQYCYRAFECVSEL